jgi:hypothetical protein
MKRNDEMAEALSPQLNEILSMERKLHPISDLSSFGHIISWLYAQINEHNFKLWYRYDFQGCLCSSIDHDRKIIMWHIAATSGLSLLWDLIHEFGHMLTGKPEEVHRGKYEWERKAWDHGWNVVTEKFPEVNDYRDSFEQRRNQQLSAFRKT